MYKFGFIGMGNMASALMNGLNDYVNGNICGSDISEDAKQKAMNHGYKVYETNKEVIENSEYIFIAVKPQVVETVLHDIKDDLRDKAVVSIVLGYDYAKYEELLYSSTRHLTIMPNTPIEVKEGMVLMEQKHSLNAEEFAFIQEAFNTCGETEILPSHLMGVGGALSGCGPAYIYLVIEALADGAVKNGLPRKSAYKLASQTVLGAGKMQLESGLHPGILKDNVTSPGGSTIRGVDALERNKVRAAFIEAIDKATNY